MSDVEPRTRAGRPSALEAKRKHAAMIDAALKEFSRHGFHGASMRAIADSAGLSTRTLYNRYSDKVALFAACLEKSSLKDLARSPKLSGPVHVQLAQFAKHMQTRLNQEQQVQLARVVYRECISFPQLAVVSRQQFERFQLGPVEHILREHGFADTQVSELARAYIALAFRKWQSRVIFGEPPLTPAEINRQIETATALFLDGVAGMANLRDGRRTDNKPMNS